MVAFKTGRLALSLACVMAAFMVVGVCSSPAGQDASTTALSDIIKSGGLTINNKIVLSPFQKAYPIFKSINTKITPGQWYFTAGLSVDSVLKQTQYLKQVVASPQLLGSEFKTYTQYFNKKYSSKAFETQAMTNFAANLKIIAEHNANPDNKFLLGANAFADLSFDDFKTIMLMPNNDDQDCDKYKPGDKNMPDKCPRGQGSQEPPEQELYNKEGHHRRLQSLPSKFNWTDYGIVTPAKNQYGCGSCWAFAATGAVESAFLQNGKTCPLPDLSEQQIVDCVNYDTQVSTEGLDGLFSFRYTGSKRCSGGWSQDAFDYIYRYYQVPESRYGYTGTNKACNTGAISGTPGGQRTSSAKTYFELPSSLKRTVNGFKSWIYWYRPMVFYFTADSAFQLYSSGIYYPSSWCNSNNINHAMLVVGWYDGGVGNPYWIIKNSWGTGWGQSGFAHVYMTGDGQGPCKMYNTGFIPTWQFDQRWSDLRACSPPPRPPPPKKSPPPPKISCLRTDAKCLIDGIWRDNINWIGLKKSPPPPKPCLKTDARCLINGKLIDNPNWIGWLIKKPPPPKLTLKPDTIRPVINVPNLGRRSLGAESPAERDERLSVEGGEEEEAGDEVREALADAVAGAGTSGEQLLAAEDQ